MDLSHSSSYIALIVPHSTTIGVDVAFDAAGSQAGLDAALPSIRVRPRGMFLDIAVFNESPQIIMNLIVLRELSLAGKLSSFTDTSCELIFKIGTAAYNGIHPGGSCKKIQGDRKTHHAKNRNRRPCKERNHGSTP